MILFPLLVSACGDGVSEALVPTTEGVALVRSGDLEGALEKFDYAISRDSNFAPAHNDRGFVYSSLEKFERAIVDFDEAIRLDPKFSVAYNNRGFAYRQLGRYPEALADYDEAIGMDPLYSDAYAGRALTNTLLGNDAQAEKDFNQAVALGYDHDEFKLEFDQVTDQR